MTFKAISQKKTSGANVATAIAGGGGGPKITQVIYTDSSYATIPATAVSTAGGYIRILGSGFVTGFTLLANNIAVSSPIFISSSEIRAQLPASTNGYVNLVILNTTGTAAAGLNSIRYSGVPTWTTSAISLTNGNTVSVQLVASSDSTLTYTLSSGTLPTGISLSSTGLLSGTVTGYTTNTIISVTFIATDSELQATQQTINISVVVADPYFKNTVLAINADQTHWLVDAANNTTITPTGSPQPSQSSPYLPYGWSGSFNGTSDYLTLPTGASGFATTLGGLASTITTMEAFIYPTAGNGARTESIIGSFPAVAANGRWVLAAVVTTTTVKVQFAWTTSTSTVSSVTSTASYPINAFYHVAVVINATTPSASTVSLFINGVGESFTAQNLSSQTSTYDAASVAQSNSNAFYFTGYISNVRVVKGAALYSGTSYTIPTAAFTAVSGTALLTLQSNRFVDNGTANTGGTGFPLTASGTPKIVATSPFAASATYDPALHGGSGYIPDASSNYLTIPNAASVGTFTGDFTIETWVYRLPTAVANNPFAIIDMRSGSGGVAWAWFMWDGVSGSGTGQLNFYTGTDRYSAATIQNNQWAHIVVSRSGSTISQWINGVKDVNTFTLSGTITATAASAGRIGSMFNNFATQGYLSNLRIVNGTAVYTGNFTPPTAPLATSGAASAASYPSYPTNTNINTTFAASACSLLTLQSPYGYNNNSFQDSSPSFLPITRSGTPTQGSLSPFSQTGWSGSFDATGLVWGNTTTTVVDTYTLEGFFYFNSVGSQVYLMGLGGNTGGNTPYLHVALEGSNTYLTLGLSSNLGGQYQWRATYTAPLNTWIHIAAVANGTSATFYVNGQARTTTLVQGTYPSTYRPTLYPWAGGILFGSGGARTDGVNGFVSNVRYVNGVAVYTGNFTLPTSPLTATQSAGTNISAITSGTQFLALQSNRFRDNSGYSTAVNVVATTTAVQPISPFAPSAAYSTAVNGGSGYFGSGNYLNNSTAAVVDFGTGNFTVEYFAYYTAYPTSGQPGLAVGTSATSTGMSFGIYSDGHLDATTSTTGYVSTGAVVPLNSWNHAAFVRSGTTLNFYLNGLLNYTTTVATNFNETGFGVGSNKAGLYPTTGYLGPVRVVKGTALYSGTSTTVPNFTVPTGPLTAVSGTSLLLNFTNAGIYDSAGKNDLITVGDAQVATTITPKFGTGSMKFDGTGDWLFLPSNPLLALGTGDFTIECWVNITSPSNSPIFESRSTDGGVNGFTLTAISSTSVRIFTSSALITATVPNYSGLWTHIAVSRVSGTTTLYVNGTSYGGTTPSLGTLSNTDAVIGGGRYGGTATINTSLNGYIDDFRITKGTARYQANFNPPTDTFITR